MEALALLGSGGAILAQDNVPDRGRVIEAGGSADGPVPKMPSDSCPKEFPVEKGEGWLRRLALGQLGDREGVSRGLGDTPEGAGLLRRRAYRRGLRDGGTGRLGDWGR